MLRKLTSAVMAVTLVTPITSLAGEDPGDSLTIYNQNVAMVRQAVPLHLG